MSEREAFDRVLASLHEVALDPAHWSTATALIDDTLRTHGSSMVFGDGCSEEDIRIYFCVGFLPRATAPGPGALSTSRTTTPWTNGSRACGISPTAGWSMLPISTPRRN